MPDIKLLRTALLAKWAYRLSNHSLEKWSISPRYFLELYGENLEVFKMIFFFIRTVIFIKEL